MRNTTEEREQSVPNADWGVHAFFTIAAIRSLKTIQ